MNNNSKVYAEAFIKKYGDSEVKLRHPVLTIMDNRPDPFSSGANGYIKKARVRNGILELYHDWWAYGWYSYDDMYTKYADATDEALRQLNIMQ